MWAAEGGRDLAIFGPKNDQKFFRSELIFFNFSDIIDEKKHVWHRFWPRLSCQPRDVGRRRGPGLSIFGPKNDQNFFRSELIFFNFSDIIDGKKTCLALVLAPFDLSTQRCGGPDGPL